MHILPFVIISVFHLTSYALNIMHCFYSTTVHSSTVLQTKFLSLFITFISLYMILITLNFSQGKQCPHLTNNFSSSPSSYYLSSQQEDIIQMLLLPWAPQSSVASFPFSQLPSHTERILYNSLSVTCQSHLFILL